MGVSSDGILYFGFAVGDDETAPEWMRGYSDFDDFICAKARLPEGATYQERKPVIDGCPAELQLYCSYDYPMHILGVRDAEHRVSRGYLKQISAAELAVDEAKVTAMKTWCETNGIEWQEPAWLLCSMYG